MAGSTSPSSLARRTGSVAIRAFEEASFRKLRQLDDPISGRSWVLIVDLARKQG
jgi:hypothetical protein